MELSYFANYFLPTAWSIFNGSQQLSVNSNLLSDQDILSSLASVIEKFVSSVSTSALEANVGYTTNAFKWVVREDAMDQINTFLRSKGYSGGDTLDDVTDNFNTYFQNYRSQLENDIQTSISAADREKQNALIRISKSSYREILDLQRLLVQDLVTNTQGIGSRSTIEIAQGEYALSKVADKLLSDGYISNIDAVGVGERSDYAYNSLTMVFVHNKVNDKFLPYFVTFSSPNNDFDFTTLNMAISTSSTDGNLFTVYAIDQSKHDLTGLTEISGKMKDSTHGWSFTKPFSGIVGYLFNQITATMKSKYLPSGGKIMEFQPAITDSFYDDMTTDQKIDVSNFEMIPYVVNNITGTGTYTPYDITVADNVKQSLIADTYDIVTVGSSDIITDRIGQDRIVTIGLDSIGDIVVTPADDLVPALPDVIVYPVDTVTDISLNPDLPITVPDIVTAIDDEIVDEGISEGMPDVPLVSPSGTYGLFTLYRITQSNLKTLASILWSEDFITNFHPFVNDPQDALISLLAYPMDITAGSSEVITCGNFECSTGIGTAYGNVVTNLFQSHSMGSVTVPKHFDNFMDYAPYTSVDLYLPFVGRVSLNPNEVVGATLTLTYRVELLTGTCAISLNVKKDNLNGKLYQYTGNMAISLPLTASNFGQMYTNLISNAMTAGIGMATGNEAGLISGGAGMVNSMFSNPKISGGGGMGGNSGMCGSMGAYLIITRAIPDTPAGYRTYKGSESNDNVLLSNVSGYVEVDSYELSCPNLMESERTELDSLLRSGIIV